MQVSKQKMNATIARQIEEVFFQLITDTKTTEEARLLFSDLLTPTEQQAIYKRLAIALFLDKGRSYENIKQYLKVSSATIASVHEIMGNPGMLLATNKVKADHFANEWSAKIAAWLEKIMPKDGETRV